MNNVIFLLLHLITIVLVSAMVVYSAERIVGKDKIEGKNGCRYFLVFYAGCTIEHQNITFESDTMFCSVFPSKVLVMQLMKENAARKGIFILQITNIIELSERDYNDWMC